MKITKDALILAQALGGGGGITPTGNQDITTLNEYDVTDKATARVSAAERAKIIPENIKQGETILGVEGSYSGGGTSAPSNDVNFYDYDGTIVYSYSAADFANLSAMPANPTHEGLTAQGWNWTLSDAKTYVASYGMLDIGQMYITDDGKTRLYITIATTGRMSPTLQWSQTVANGVTIDWGDGSATETAMGAGPQEATHTYTAVGDYVITLNPAEGCALILAASILKTINYQETDPYRNMLRRVELGSAITALGDSCFESSSSLTTITMPSSITSLGMKTLYKCFSLKSIIIPSAVSGSLYSSFCMNCYSLTSISMPKGITGIGSFQNANSLVRITTPNGVTSMGGFNKCFSLKTVTIPGGMTSIPDNMFYQNYSLEKITIPSGITEIKDAAFRQCVSLTKLIFPSGLTSIAGSYVFFANEGMAIYDFSACTTVPTLANSTSFQSIPADCRILVPAALYDTWKAASNWSNYASYIVAV